MPEDPEVTELIEIDPSRVDAVGSPANGTDWLILKSIDGQVVETQIAAEDVLAEITKADDGDGDNSDDRPDCKTCDGTGKIMEGHRKCPKCLGSGKQPQVGDSAKASAPSGAPVPVRKDCPTCNGSGTLPSTAGGVGTPTECPDCNGSGNDGQMPPVDKLNAQPGFAGSSDDGDGRTAVDKAEISGKSMNDLPDSAFAYIEPGGKKDDEGKTVPRSLRHFPVHDEAHARNALSRAPQSPFGAKAMPKIKAAAKKFGIEVSAKGLVEKDGVVSGANPFLGGSMSGTPDDSDTECAPGSPEWEAADAELATGAANAILQAYELTRQFRDREAIEVAAGEGNDVFDTFEASCVLDLLSSAIGAMATLAFHEGIAAQKSEDAAEKSGARLSGDTLNALVAARALITDLLGDDDPESDSDSDDDDDDGDDDNDSDSDDSDEDDDDDATKAILAKEIEDMTVDELTKVLDGRDEKLVNLLAEALKGMPATHEGESIANAKNANNKSKKKMPKDDNTDLEDEADQGDNDSASGTNQATGAAKSEDADVELTPEEIEAKAARKEAKKALKAAEEAEKQAAENARTAKAIEEAVTKATEAVTSLQDQLAAANAATEARIAAAAQATEQRLATVEKMAAPGGPVKTRTPEMTTKAASRDTTELRIATLERELRETSDPTVREGNRELLKELRASLTAAN